MPRRESTLVNAIVLGNKPVLSTNDDRFTEPPCEPAADFAVDWQVLFEQAGLSADERQFFEAHRIDGTPLRLVHLQLGWSRQQVEAVRGRVRRKLGRLDGSSEYTSNLVNSRHPFFLERLPSGHRTWSLPVLTEANYASVMSAEMLQPKKVDLKAKKVSAGHPQTRFLAGISRSTILEPTTNFEELRQSLAAARQRLTEVQRLSGVAEERHRGLLAELQGARQALEEEVELALLEEREPKKVSRTRVADIEERATTAERTVHAAERVWGQQFDTVNAIEEQIRSGQLEEFRARVVEHRESFHRAMVQLVSASYSIALLAHEHGVNAHAMLREIFPARNPADPLEGYTARGLMARLFGGALEIANHHLAGVAIPEFQEVLK